MIVKMWANKQKSFITTITINICAHKQTTYIFTYTYKRSGAERGEEKMEFRVFIFFSPASFISVALTFDKPLSWSQLSATLT